MVVLKISRYVFEVSECNLIARFFFHFINNFAKELIKILTQFLLYYFFRINSISGMPETITTPYSSTQAAKEGTDITKMTSFLSKTFFFDFPLLKLSEYRQTKNPNSINHSQLLKLAYSHSYFENPHFI